MKLDLAVLPLAAVALLATGCRKSENANMDTTAAGATTAPAAMAPAGATTGATTGAAAAPSGQLTDANIVYILDQANIADSARGALAETKGTSADVKSFGKLMVGEHHALRAEGQALAKKLNVTPQAPSGDQSEAQAKQEMDSLTAMAKGPAWDKAYIGYEVTYHQQVIDVATKALAAAQNAQLKALIQKAAPVLKHHLERAQAIQKKLGA